MIQLKQYQKEGVRAIYRFKGRALLADDQGLGKAQPVTTKVSTPNGWRCIGDLKIGDLVTSSSGHPTRVVGVYPQGIKRTYRMKFSDDSSVQCCEDHLWALDYYIGGRTKKRIVTSTKHLLSKRIKTTWDNGRTTVLDVPKTALYIPMLSAPIQYQKQGSVEIPSYVMGLLLANGGLTNSGTQLSAHADDWSEIKEKLIGLGIEVGSYQRYGNGVRASLIGLKDKVRMLGLDVLSGKKFIPDLYLRQSKEERIELLKGLMDGDGSITETGNKVTYHTTSKLLSEDIQELVQGLGGIAKEHIYDHKGTQYMLCIRVPSFIGAPFFIKRKGSRYTQGVRTVPTRRLVDIKPSGKQECVCIAVDAEDHLYCTENAILTHNTAQALEWIRRIPKRRPVIIVTPSSVKYTWQSEASVHFGIHADVLDGTKVKGRDIRKCQIIILNYDILKDWLPKLKKLRPKCIIFDEIQMLKSIESKRTLAAADLVEGVASVVGLSGTPFTNTPIELWPILQIIKPDLFPSMTKFAWKFCRPKYTPWGWKFTGAQNTIKLNSILRNNVMIRRLKKDVLKELPDKIRQVVSFKLDSYKEYEQAEKNFLGWLGSKSMAKAAKAKRSAALVKVGYLLRLVVSKKLKLTTKWVSEFFEANPGEKLVLMTMHTEVIEHYKKHFPDCVVVDGSVTGVNRQRAVKQFQTNPRTMLFVGNWKAAGVGLTLTAASNLVAHDLPWTPGDLRQGEDRIHRIGQKRVAIIHYMTVLSTLEEKLMKMLQDKSGILDSVLNGTDASMPDFNLFDELLKEMVQ